MSLRYFYEVTNWTVYPGSKLAQLPQPIRFAGLVYRNIRDLARAVRHKVVTDPYQVMIRAEYDKAAQLAVAYVMSSDVRGDIAEFGTHGITAQTLAKQLAYYGSDRRLHMFDTFRGFPKLTAPEDVASPHIVEKIWKEGAEPFHMTPAKLRGLLEKRLTSDQVRIYEGTYEKTLSDIPKDARFALLVMDCCLYKSHLEALTYVFQHGLIVDGAMVMFSDWNVNRGSNEFGPRKAWAQVAKSFAIDFSDEGSYCWGGRKFIVHSYRK